MNKIFSIYKISFPNNKVYVGLTCNFKARKYNHLFAARNPKYPVNRALALYSDLCVWEIIYQSKCSDDINQKEMYFIKLYNSNNPEFGYNLTAGGEGVWGFRHSEKSKKLNSEAKKAHFKTNPEHLQKQIINLEKFRKENPNYNREKAIKQWSTEESRKKHGEIMKKVYKEKGFSGGKPAIPIKLIMSQQLLKL